MEEDIACNTFSPLIAFLPFLVPFLQRTWVVPSTLSSPHTFPSTQRKGLVAEVFPSSSLLSLSSRRVSRGREEVGGRWRGKSRGKSRPKKSSRYNTETSPSSPRMTIIVFLPRLLNGFSNSSVCLSSQRENQETGNTRRSLCLQHQTRVSTVTVYFIEEDSEEMFLFLFCSQPLSFFHPQFCWSWSSSSSRSEQSLLNSRQNE